MQKKEAAIIMYYLGIPVQLSPELDDFRKKFDPKYKVNEAHATLVAPFPASLMTQELSDYIARTIAQYVEQEIIADGYYITPCGHIFYTFDAKTAQLLSDIYNRLHEHPALASRKERNREFMPHITIGKFENKHAVPENVLAMLPGLCITWTLRFDRVRLYGILDEPRKRVHVQDYMCLISNTKQIS